LGQIVDQDQELVIDLVVKKLELSFSVLPLTNRSAQNVVESFLQKELSTQLANVFKKKHTF